MGLAIGFLAMEVKNFLDHSDFAMRFYDEDQLEKKLI
jgi:hypothetical protein